jgi:hypothetical protein
MSEFEWEPPVDLQEAYDRRRKLRDEIRSMEAQLADKRIRRQKTEEDYDIWRSKVIWAMYRRLAELRLVKIWIKEEERKAS